MTRKTKEFINNFYYEIKQTQKRKKRKGRKTIFGPPPDFMTHPIFGRLEYIIVLNDLSQICPRQWDEFELNLKDRDKRYSAILNTDVIKVTNIYNYNQIKEKDLGIAFPIDGVVHKSLSIELEEYIRDYIFIQMSRRIIMNSGHYYEKDDIHEVNREKAIKFIFKFIKEVIQNAYQEQDQFEFWVAYYKEFNVDFEEMLKIFRGEEIIKYYKSDSNEKEAASFFYKYCDKQDEIFNDNNCRKFQLEYWINQYKEFNINFKEIIMYHRFHEIFEREFTK